MINNVTPDNASALTIFGVDFTSNITGTEAVSYRWDFGDGSAYTPVYPNPDASHTYATCGDYTVRVEVTDSLGNRVVSSEDVSVSMCVKHLLDIPVVLSMAPAP